MKFKRNGLFIVLLCLFLCFFGLVYKASGAPGDSCSLNNVCEGCHNASLSLCGSGGEYLKLIDGNTEKHGLNNADTSVVLNIHPDTPVDLAPRLVLGGALYCTDCHEDHGIPTPNAFQLKGNVNNIPVEVPITQLDVGVCSLPGTPGNRVMGWFCRTCHKDDAKITRNLVYKNQWKYAHHFSGGVIPDDHPYNRTRCYNCHQSSLGEPINCGCCHYHGSMTTDYGTSYPCYLSPYVCRSPYDRGTF